MVRRTTRLRSSRRNVRLDFGAIEIVGGILTPDMIARIAAFEAVDQNEENYGVPPGLKIRDEIARYFRIGEALWTKFDSVRAASPAASEKFALDLLKQCFGFETLAAQPLQNIDEREFPVGYTAASKRIPVVIAPAPAPSARRTGLDESLTQFGDGTRRRSATLLLQEYLNAFDQSLWGLTLDGSTLRLMRDNVSLTRPAWIEANLAKIFSEGLFPDFTVLWLLIHQSRFGGAKADPSDSSLERWRDAGRVEGVAARDKLRRGVESALVELGQGFIEHSANGALRQALTDGKLSRQGYFEELLRLIYRLIFLFAAEDRELLHAPGADQAATTAYAQGYSLSRLRERCMRRTSWDRNTDAWEGLKATFAALGKGEGRLGLPALGGLFADEQLSNLAGCKIANSHLLSAIWRLAWMRPDGHPLTRVNWRDMETEELGSVYESLLELTPIASADTRTFTFAEGDETRGNARKVSGSYYTPDSLVQALLNESLDPLIEETIAGKNDTDAIEALLSLRIIDPACGSGHFLLAAARRLASRIARLSSPGTPSQADFRHWLREVARRCLFGVDRNPMAIELAKVALWIETVEPGKPLSFLDAHLRCGDSLLGVYDLRALEIGIPDDAYKPLTGDNKAASSAWKKLNKQARERDDKTIELVFTRTTGELAGSAQKIETQGEDDLAGVEAKRRAFESLVGEQTYQRVKTACDLYIAAFLLPKVQSPELAAGAKGVTIPTTSAVRDKLSGLLAVSDLEATAIRISKAARAFHWPLEFPQVFFPVGGRKAGFDLALGNPPWEVNQLGEEEYFSARAPEVSQLKGKARKDAIKALERNQPHLWTAYQDEKRRFDASNEFFRSSGRFALTAIGKMNTYALFAELFSSMAKKVGVLLPTGISTDLATSQFFQHVINHKRLRALYSFYEVRKWFKGTDDRKSFCIFAMGENEATARFSFDIDEISELHDKRRTFTLTPQAIQQINPNTKTSPVFRSEADASLTATIYANVPILINETVNPPVNPWQVDFRQGLFNMTSDSGSFFVAEQMAAQGFKPDGSLWRDDGSKEVYLPLCEGKLINIYDHRWASFVSADDEETVRLCSIDEKRRPDFEVSPRYWVKQSDVDLRLKEKQWDHQWLMGWRDVALRSVERTVIPAVFPRFAASHKLPLFFARGGSADAACLLAILSSIVLDYVARQKIGGNSLTYFYLKQLPILPPSAISRSDRGFIAARVVELCYTADTLRPFAHDLGYTGEAFRWDESRRALLRAEVDAKIAKLYGLTRDELRYILDPADVYGADYPSETFRVLKNSEIAKHGEYRTAKLVLSAFDQISEGTLATEVVRLSSDKVEVRAPKVAEQEYTAGAWQRERSDLRGETGAMLVALLKAMDAPLSARQVRLAAIVGLEPRLLHPYLDATKSSEWSRLIGNEALPLPAGTAPFVPPTDQHWGVVVRGLRTSGALVEELGAGTWGPGTGLEKIETEGWPDGRARFVLDVLMAADQKTVIEQLPDDVRRWLDAEAA